MKKNLLVGLFCLFNLSIASADITTDTGHIAAVFSDAGDSLAIMLDGNFPNATAATQCPAATSWAYVPKPMRATALLAKALGKQVQVGVSGCYTNGAWLNVILMYILD